jgi:hypothetical protein
MAHLKVKAGLPFDAWPSGAEGSVRVGRYRALKFHE